MALWIVLREFSNVGLAMPKAALPRQDYGTDAAQH